MHVSLLAYDGCLSGELFGFADVLLIANRISQASPSKRPVPFQVTVVGVRDRPVQTAGGVNLMVESPAKKTDLLVVPAFEVVAVTDLERTLPSLRAEVDFIARSAKRSVVAAICGGSFLLGEAGLLHGRRVTTAWPFAAELARRYPTAIVEPEALLVSDAGITTSGAFSACGDLALKVVREHASPGLARATGRVTLIGGERSSQAPYVDVRLLARGQGTFAERVNRWLELRLAQPYSLEQLARALNVSSRTLLRKFKAETGRSPLDRLHDLRIMRAKELVETTSLGLAEIAMKVGYQDLSTFVKLFARKVSVTPGAYRRRFRSLHQL